MRRGRLTGADLDTKITFAEHGKAILIGYVIAHEHGGIGPGLADEPQQRLPLVRPVHGKLRHHLSHPNVNPGRAESRSIKASAVFAATLWSAWR
nr:hypothetical protein [Candidatus Microthrix sp.]